VMKMLYHSLDLKFPESDPRARDVAMLGEKMNHLNKIVEQILDFARSAEPKMGLVDVNKLIDDLALLTRHKLKNLSVELVRKLDPSLPPLTADSVQLEQAFLNLLLNAIQAMPKGGLLTVTSASMLEHGNERPTGVTVEFKDNGAGMTAEQQKRAFTSLLGTTKSDGTGLGLAIVKRVVEAHRGQIELKSRPGKGTSIRLLLPI